MAKPPPASPPEDEVARFLRHVGDGRIEDVRAMLAAAPGLARAVGPHPYWGGRPQGLHVAIETRRREMVDLLLDGGADANGDNEGYDHWSPLMLAIDRDRPDLQRVLLDRGARVGLVEALMLADDAAVEALLRPGGAALPAAEPNRGSLLAFARTPFAIDRLLELGVSPDRRDRWGTSPIEAMSRLGPRGAPLVRHMVARGIPARPQDFARLGDREALAALAEADAGVLGAEAVMMGAVDFRHHDLVRWLLDHGAPAGARAAAQSRHTALHSAAWNGDLEMARLLVEGGADLTALDEEHQGTPRHWAEVSVTVSNNPKCRAVAEYLAGLEAPPS